MRRVLLVLALLLPAAAAWAEPDEYGRIERGRYLVIVGDCLPCHTAPGGAPFAGGRGLATPFGTIDSANITPDAATGIGNWTADDFDRAVRAGVRPDGTNLYPALPYGYYTKMSRADTDAILAFLRTLPAASHAVNRDTLPFPFSIRASLRVWNALFFTPGQFQPDPARSGEYSRGAFLVEGPGHCGACHTPINLLGGSVASAAYRGGTLDAWVAPDLTDDRRTGLGDWSIDDVTTYLRTGRNAHSQASGPMAEVVVNSTSQMTEADLRAMAVYLKQRSGAAGPASPASPLDKPAMEAGAAIYQDTCGACHARDGSGVALLFPPLAGNQVVQQADPTTLLRIVMQGVRGAATDAAPTAPAMPAFGWRLSNEQVAAVVTYIRNSWGNAAPAVDAAQARTLRARIAPTMN